MFSNWFTRKYFAFSSAKHTFTLIRNGETIWSKDKKWVGWADVPLSSFGIKEIKDCSNVLKKNGVHYDVVYTSLLTRAIKSTNYILDELNCLYIPVIKDWRLNQKHYGALQGCSKIQMTQKHGEKIVNQWRASLNVPPPALEKNDPNHPINNELYKDIDPSLLPSSECLNDVVKRIKPLWLQLISKDIKEGKNVLAVAHGSSLRALIMTLMPYLTEQQIKFFKIPNGVPISLTLDENLKVTNIDYEGDENEIEVKMNKLIFQTQKNEI